MKTKIIIGIVILIGIVGIAVSISDSPPSDVFPGNTPAESFDVSQVDGQCRELMYDGDINSWVESTNSLGNTINECDEKFIECYNIHGNVYGNVVQCINTP